MSSSVAFPQEGEGKQNKTSASSIGATKFPPHTYSHLAGEEPLVEVPKTNLYGKFIAWKHNAASATAEWLSDHPKIAAIVSDIIALFKSIVARFTSEKEAEKVVEEFEDKLGTLRAEKGYYETALSKGVPDQSTAMAILMVMNNSKIDLTAYEEHRNNLAQTLRAFGDKKELDEILEKFPRIPLLNEAVTDRKIEISQAEEQALVEKEASRRKEEEVQKAHQEKVAQLREKLPTLNREGVRPLKEQLDGISQKYSLPIKKNFNDQLTVAEQTLKTQSASESDSIVKLQDKIASQDAVIKQEEEYLNKLKETEIKKYKEENRNKQQTLESRNEAISKEIQTLSEKKSSQFLELATLGINWKEPEVAKEGPKSVAPEVGEKSTVPTKTKKVKKPSPGEKTKKKSRVAAIEEEDSSTTQLGERIQKEITHLSSEMRRLDEKYVKNDQELKKLRFEEESDPSSFNYETISVQKEIVSKERLTRDELTGRNEQHLQKYQSLQEDLGAIHRLHGEYSNLVMSGQDINNVKELVDTYLALPEFASRKDSKLIDDLMRALEDHGYGPSFLPIVNSYIRQISNQR